MVTEDPSVPGESAGTTEHARLKEGVTPLLENVSESATACLLTMVQGNVLALTLGHWLIASRTGVVAGIFATVATMVIRSRSKWVIAGVLCLVTATVDYFTHPTHFGVAVAEAVVTGLAAGALSLLVSNVRRRRK
jgi:hypothetical protein